MRFSVTARALSPRAARLRHGISETTCRRRDDRGVRIKETGTNGFRATNAILRIRTNEIDSGKQLVFPVLNVDVLVFQIQLKLLHLRPVFESDLDGLCNRQDVRLAWPPDTRHRSDSGHDQSGVGLESD